MEKTNQVKTKKLLANEMKYLKLFEKKTKELSDSDFSKQLPGSKVKLKISQNGDNVNGMIQRWGPSSEAIKSFAVTFRNFILDEEISIQNIAAVYDQLENDNDLKKEFIEIRNYFNVFLDSPSIFILQSKRLTRKQLLETYYYGDLIHFNKIDEFETWNGIPVSKELVINELVSILASGAKYIYHFNDINTRYIESIKETRA